MGTGGSKGKTKNERKKDLNNPISFTKEKLKQNKLDNKESLIKNIIF